MFQYLETWAQRHNETMSRKEKTLRRRETVSGAGREFRQGVHLSRSSLGSRRLMRASSSVPILESWKMSNESDRGEPVDEVASEARLTLNELDFIGN